MQSIFNFSFFCFGCLVTKHLSRDLPVELYHTVSFPLLAILGGLFASESCSLRLVTFLDFCSTPQHSHSSSLLAFAAQVCHFNEIVFSFFCASEVRVEVDCMWHYAAGHTRLVVYCIDKFSNN